MGNLLDSILGRFNSGDIGGFSTDRMISTAPPSDNLPEDPVSTPSANPYGNRVGGPALGVPLSRPPETAPPSYAPNTEALDLRPGGVGGQRPGGLAAALGLDPDRAKTVMASLASGLSNVRNSPFAGQVAANAAGGAIAGGNKAEDTVINQALKLRQIQQKAPAIDEETRRAAQADREGTLAQARAAVVRDPSKRAAIIARLQQLGIAF
jgi:hypothetical protein